MLDEWYVCRAVWFLAAVATEPEGCGSSTGSSTEGAWLVQDLVHIIHDVCVQSRNSSSRQNKRPT